MRWSIRVALLAGVVATVSAPVLAALHVKRAGGFGDGDILSFAFWSLFFGALVATIAPSVLRFAGRWRRIVAVPVAAVGGPVAAAVFSMVMILALGPLVGAFSFPILHLWAAAGALGLMIAAWLQPPPEEASVAPRPRLRRVLGLVGLVLVATVAFPFVLLLGSIFLWNRAEREVHLLPAGYEGPVVIIFGDSAGAPARREGRARVYEIPGDGVLRTQFAPNHGWGAPDYYHVGAGGARTPIVRSTSCRDTLPGDPVQVCSMATMYIGGRTAPPYTGYIVGRQRDHDALAERGYNVVHWAVYGDSAHQRR